MAVNEYPHSHGSLAGLSDTDHHRQYVLEITGTFAQRPTPGRVGRIYYATDTGVSYRDTGTAWVGHVGPRTLRVPHTFSVPGDILAPVGSDNVIPGFFISLAGGQTARLVSARYSLTAGTSVIVAMFRNGSQLGNPQTVQQTPATYDISDVALAENDYISIAANTPIGTPKNMSFTIFIEYTS